MENKELEKKLAKLEKQIKAMNKTICALRSDCTVTKLAVCCLNERLQEQLDPQIASELIYTTSPDGSWNGDAIEDMKDGITQGNAATDKKGKENG